MLYDTASGGWAAFGEPSRQALLLCLLLVVLAAFATKGWTDTRRWAASPVGGAARRTVLITGAASGLGRCVALHSAARGDLVVALDVNAAGLAGLSEDCSPAATIVAVCCDVSNAAEVARAVQSVRKRLGGRTIDVVANFAGLIRGGPLLEMDDSDLEHVMAVNVLGTQRVVKAFVPLMHTEDRKGMETRMPSPKIIVVASELSYASYSAGFSAPYSMSKFALEAYAASLRLELSLLPSPIHVVVINPGAMDTPMLRNQMPGGSNAYFGKFAARGSVYEPFLRRGEVLAQDYMNRNKSDPQRVATVVDEIVHTQKPATRYVIGASFAMRWLIPYIPQRVLDAVTRLELQRPNLCAK